MKLLEIEIENFMAISYLKVVFEPKVTTIELPNMEGKTSLGIAVYVALTGLNIYNKSGKLKSFISKRWKAKDFKLTLKTDLGTIVRTSKTVAQDFNIPDVNVLAHSYCFEQIDVMKPKELKEHLKDLFFSDIEADLTFPKRIAESQALERKLSEDRAEIKSRVDIKKDSNKIKELEDRLVIVNTLDYDVELKRSLLRTIETIKARDKQKCPHCNESLLSSKEIEEIEAMKLDCNRLYKEYKDITVTDDYMVEARDIRLDLSALKSVKEFKQSELNVLNTKLQQQILITADLEEREQEQAKSLKEKIDSKIGELGFKRFTLSYKVGKTEKMEIAGLDGVTYELMSRSEQMLAVREIQCKVGWLHWDDNVENIDDDRNDIYNMQTIQTRRK